MKKYYSVKFYAAMVGLTTQAIYNKIKNDKIDYIPVEIGNDGKHSYIIIVYED